MASPYVASLAVRILESFPSMNIYELRQLLFESCSPLRSMNESHQNQSGYGIINSEALDELLTQKKHYYENQLSKST